MDATNSRVTLPWKDLFLVSCIGFIFILMNLPKLVTRLVTTLIEQPGLQTALLWPVMAVQDSLSSLQGSDPGTVFAKLIEYDYLALFAFALISLIAALRHKDIKILLFAAGGLALGYFALHLISWFALLLVTIAKVFAYLLGLVYLIVGWVWGLLGAWWLVLGAVVALLFVWRDLRELLRAKLRQILLWVGGVTLAGALAYKFVPPVWFWFLRLIEPVLRFFKAVAAFLEPILRFLVSAITWLVSCVLTGALVFFVLNIVGRLVVDQIRAAWNSGRSRKEMALGGFALGSAVALVILMSVGSPPLAQGIDAGWQNSLATLDRLLHAPIASPALGWLRPAEFFLAVLPGSVEAFVLDNFRSVNPPLVDALLLLVVTLIATGSVLRSLLAETSSRTALDVPVYFLPREYLLIAGGLLASVSFSFVQALSEGDLDISV